MDPFCAPCVTRQPAPHVYYGTTKGLCSTCRRSLDAKIHFEDDRVWFAKYCPEHGHERRLVSSSVGWYLDALSFLSPSTPPEGTLRPVRAGCPFDCGPCVAHQQRMDTTSAPAALSIAHDQLGELGARFDRLLGDPAIEVLEVNLNGASPGVPEVHEALRAHTGDRVVTSDFVPSPLAHPHCFSVLHVLLLPDGGFVPFARLLGRERTFELLAEGRYLQPSAALAAELRRARDVEPRFKAVHVHAHMDVESFDVARVMRCSVGVARDDGATVPYCVHTNVPRDTVVAENPTERRALPIVR